MVLNQNQGQYLNSPFFPTLLDVCRWLRFGRCSCLAAVAITGDRYITTWAIGSGSNFLIASIFYACFRSTQARQLASCTLSPKLWYGTSSQSRCRRCTSCCASWEGWKSLLVRSNWLGRKFHQQDCGNLRDCNLHSVHSVHSIICILEKLRIKAIFFFGSHR